MNKKIISSGPFIWPLCQRAPMVFSTLHRPCLKKKPLLLCLSTTAFSNWRGKPLVAKHKLHPNGFRGLAWGWVQLHLAALKICLSENKSTVRREAIMTEDLNNRLIWAIRNFAPVNSKSLYSPWFLFLIPRKKKSNEISTNVINYVYWCLLLYSPKQNLL